MSTSKKFFLWTLIILFLALLALLARHFYPAPTSPQLPEQKEKQTENIVKYAQTGVYEVFTLSTWAEYSSKELDKLDQTSCDDGISECMNIIAKNGNVIMTIWTFSLD